MCGIGGCVGGSCADQALLRKMSHLIRHRGPDQYGEFLDRGVGLFSNRLSIIDLEGGRQPIFNEDKNLVIVFNGEIYNFQEIRRLLESSGHKFKTRSDTEVILHGFEQYGTGIFSMLNGMFAIALWDNRSKRLVLARDRVGIKPLYYTNTQSGDLVFCSEIKGILAHPEVKASVSEQGLYSLVSLYYIPFELTLFSGIFKIPPGHYYDSLKKEIGAYWSAPPEKDYAPDTKTIQRALEESVERQLVSDVEVGSFLSGGLDTGTVVAFASKHYPHKLKTFCMGFGHEDDELEDAQKISEYFGTDHHGFQISDRATLEMYPQMIWHSEQPKLNTYSWFVNEFAHKYVKVCLSGLGGDELFFGYPTSSRFTSFQKAQKLMKIPGAQIFSFVASGKRKAVLSQVKDRAATYLTTVSPTFGSLDSKVFSYDISSYRRGLRDKYGSTYFDNNSDFVEQAVYAEFGTKLCDDFLAIDDSMSMAHSLENRVPLLDNQLVDLMLPIPYKYNYQNGVGKGLLREAMQGILPEGVFKKPKQGFSLNILKWWPGELGEEIRSTIPESAAVRKYFNVPALVDLIPSAANSYTSVSLLWHIYAFHVWHDVFIENGEKSASEFSSAIEVAS